MVGGEGGMKWVVTEGEVAGGQDATFEILHQ